MCEVLSQEETDALLAAVMESDKTDKLKDKAPPSKPMSKVKIYDFTRPDMFTKDHIRSIQMIFEDFSRRVHTLLPRGERVSFFVTVVDQFTYEEFVRSTPSPSYCVLAADIFSGKKWCFEFDSKISFALVSILMGKEQSQVEACWGGDESLALRNFVQSALNVLRESWKYVSDIDLAIEQVEESPQYLSGVRPNEMGVCISIEVNVGQVDGMMNVFIPQSTLVKSLEQIKNAPYKKLGVKMENLTPKEPSGKTLKDIRVRLSACLGTVECSLGAISNFGEGSIITLDKIAGSPVDVYANDVKIAEAEVVVVDENFGLRLTQVVAPLDV